jgi:hypothetical protein
MGDEIKYTAEEFCRFMGARSNFKFQERMLQEVEAHYKVNRKAHSADFKEKKREYLGALENYRRVVPKEIRDMLAHNTRLEEIAKDEMSDPSS